MTDDSTIDRHLAELDPVAADPAPVRGSARYETILERAMTTTPTSAAPTVATPQSTTTATPPTATRPRRRRVAVLGAAVAAAIIVVVAVVGIKPDAAPAPAAALTMAADRTADATTLRVDYRRDDGAGGTTIVRTEQNGPDSRRAYLQEQPDGSVVEGERDEALTIIGDREWVLEGGELVSRQFDPSEHNAPYAASSAAIIDAIVDERTVTDLGTDRVRGADADHYRIRLDRDAIRALDRLPVNQRSGFELESPGMVKELDVWIGDGLIRRIEVHQDPELEGSAGTTIDFYDFGADITIEPPE